MPRPEVVSFTTSTALKEAPVYGSPTVHNFEQAFEFHNHTHISALLKNATLKVEDTAF